MNPHYHPYTELPSPHSPPPDNYHHVPMSNGHLIGGGGPHHEHHPHHHGSPFGGLHQHHLGNSNNNSNNTNNNSNNNNNNNNNSNNNSSSNNNNNNNSSSNNNNNNNCGSGLKICGGCGGKIVERFLLHALDRYWHNGCLKCSCCHAMLADIGSSCFTKAGMILCKTDYASEAVSGLNSIIFKVQN
ncbi:hypothetical protein RUM43_009613 [Polyplax serrata]|uniref:LIM zinc-binding domain-containing protein n=1 Tax=Polyplax serrata TaxID=468196 RepID=A0AAN8NVQ7_POLSC